MKREKYRIKAFLWDAGFLSIDWDTAILAFSIIAQSGSAKILRLAPSKRYPLYGAWTKFDSANKARHGLQIRYDPAHLLDPEKTWSNARVRISFDSLQILDNIAVPKGLGGKADWLEPITKDYPDAGLGGFPQFIIWDVRIVFDEVTLLPEQSTAIVPYEGPFLPTVYEGGYR